MAAARQSRAAAAKIGRQDKSSWPHTTLIHMKASSIAIYEGTVLEGVVTNHIDGGFSGPIMIMLTTDYYSHDHQQLLMPQGTRLIGTVQSVGNAQQRKMFVSFHRAICPDGFSLDFDKYMGLDPIGTTGACHQGRSRIFAGVRCRRCCRRLGRPGADRQQRQHPRLLRLRFATESPSSRLTKGNRY